MVTSTPKDKKLVVIHFEDLPDKDIIKVHEELRKIEKEKLPNYHFIVINRKLETISEARLLAALGVK